MKLTKNFNLIEAQSKDGSEMPKDVLAKVKRHAKYLQEIRDRLGCRLTVNSWYRSPKHNTHIGGAKNSWHLTGLATDLSSPFKEPIEIYNTILELIEEGVIPEGGIKCYNTFVHYDSRGVKARW